MSKSVVCPVCHGKGRIDRRAPNTQPCEACKGRSVIPLSYYLKLQVVQQEAQKALRTK